MRKATRPEMRPPDAFIFLSTRAEKRAQNEMEGLPMATHHIASVSWGNEGLLLSPVQQLGARFKRKRQQTYSAALHERF
jgi:hypothetical protein